MATTGTIIPSGELCGSVNKCDTQGMTKVIFKATSQFPKRGHPRYLYVSTDENKIYRWENGYILISGGGTGTGAEINDNLVSPSATWSSNKINAELTLKAKADNVYTKEEVNEMFSNTGVNADVATEEDIQNLF